MKPYYQDAAVTIYHGDSRELLSQMPRVSAIVTDPPYGDTSIKWDVWPAGWPALCRTLAPVLWSFGSLRMFMDKRDEFEGWTLAQDIVWEKHNGSSPFNDRFRRVHEHALQFYQGAWADIFKSPIYTNDATAKTIQRKARPEHWGAIGGSTFVSEDGGPRLQRSVIFCRSCHGRAIHPTQKPDGIVRPLVEYSVPMDGIVLDPFMGSGTTLAVAKESGRRGIGIERDEKFCEQAALRMSQGILAMDNQINPQTTEVIP